MKKYLMAILVGSAALMWPSGYAMAGKLRIAVVDFGILNATKDESKQLTQTFRDTLAKNAAYEVVSRDDIEQAFLTEDPTFKIKLEQYECINQEMACAYKVNQKTGAETVIEGKIIRQKDKDVVVILARAIDSKLRRVDFEASEEATVTGADLNKMMVALAQKVDRWLPKEGETQETATTRRLEEQRREEAHDVAQIKERQQQLAQRQAGTCPEGMVLIRAGEFTMGSDPSDPDRGKTELENKKVNLPEFCIDMYEYPNKKGANPYINAEWFAGKEECGKQGKRLCTEEEWEKACKGTQGFKFSYGNTYDPNKCGTAKDAKTPGKLAKVGDKSDCHNDLGIYDMSGNVWEWTSSEFDPEFTRVFVIRGGSFKNDAKGSRCASRKGTIPFTHQPDIGFRCCK